MSQDLVIAQLLLLLAGLIGVATSEPGMLPDHAGKVAISLVLTFLISRLRTRAFIRVAWPVYLVTIVLLILTLIIGVGTQTSPGVKRWLDFGGSVRFQPSELAKLGLILQLASFFARRGVERKLISAIGFIGLSTVFVLIEPDLGSTVLIFSLGLLLMFAAGVRFTNISGLVLIVAILCLPVMSFYLDTHPYILARLHGHTDAAKAMLTGLDQIGLAHRDLTYGGFWGQGPSGPRYSYFAAHTDMIIASVGFSTGLLGVITVLFAYCLVVKGALKVTSMAIEIRPMNQQVHGAVILASGSMFMVIAQAFVNLAVAAGIFPVTGVPLPLVSYGFSSMFTMSVAFALIHSSLREVRRHLPVGDPRRIPFMPTEPPAPGPRQPQLNTRHRRTRTPRPHAGLRTQQR